MVKAENHLEKAEKEIEEYIKESKCRTCIGEAEIIIKILQDIITLHKKGEDFVLFLNSSPYLKILTELREKSEVEE